MSSCHCSSESLSSQLSPGTTYSGVQYQHSIHLSNIFSDIYIFIKNVPVCRIKLWLNNIVNELELVCVSMRNVISYCVELVSSAAVPGKLSPIVRTLSQIILQYYVDKYQYWILTHCGCRNSTNTMIQHLNTLNTWTLENDRLTNRLTA